MDLLRPAEEAVRLQKQQRLEEEYRRENERRREEAQRIAEERRRTINRGVKRREYLLSISPKEFEKLVACNLEIGSSIS